MSKVYLWQASRGGRRLQMAFLGRKAMPIRAAPIEFYGDLIPVAKRLIKLIVYYTPYQRAGSPWGKMIWLDFQRFSVRKLWECESQGTVVTSNVTWTLEPQRTLYLRHHLEPPETLREVGMWCRIFIYFMAGYHWFTDVYWQLYSWMCPLFSSDVESRQCRIRSAQISWPLAVWKILTNRFPWLYHGNPWYLTNPSHFFNKSCKECLCLPEGSTSHAYRF